MTRKPGANLGRSGFDEAVERFWHLMRTEGGDDRRQALDWVARSVQRHLGKDWFDRALQNPGLFAETYFLPCHRTLIVSAVERALRLDELDGRQGFARTRKQMGGDVTTATVAHMDVVMEVAALAQAAGAAPRFEVELGAVPIDVVLDTRAGFVPVEVTAVHLDKRFRDTDARSSYLGDAARAIGWQESVSIDLDFEHLPPNDEMFLADLRDVIRSTHIRPLTLAMPGVEVTIRSDDALGELSGPVVDTNYIDRVASSVARKASKDYAPRPVWLRVEVLNGLWALSPWAQYELPHKMAAIRAALVPSLDPTKVAGLVLSPGRGLALDPVEDASHGDLDGSWAIRRNVSGWRYREVIALVTDARWKHEAQLWRAMYELEQTWLDDAVLRSALPPVDRLY